MPNKYSQSIFISRRDLRLNDNIGLLHALENSDKVIPIFIFTPEQLDSNSYKSDNCVQFMVESLEDLDKSLKNKRSRLFYFYGSPAKVVERVLKKGGIDAVFVNMDYTPYAIKRDSQIEKVCKRLNVHFESLEDVLLNPVGTITTTGGTVYTKFTPYFNKAKKIKVPEVRQNRFKNFVSKNKQLVGEYKKGGDKFFQHNEELANRGGRANALKILGSIQNFRQYNQKRNDMTHQTTHLSAHIKFGCVSIREVYYAFKNKLGVHNDLIKQLYWRDFYYNVGYEYPIIFSSKGNLKENYDKVKWENNRSYFNKWKEGKTGFPIVDASIRQMNETGFMHNRGRLIVSGFLIKILLIDWKWGEKYFAQTLQDYDMCVNTGNWGWASGSGADSQPYFRIFSPWLQSEKYDKDAKYIKKWVPELKDMPPKHIHRWYKYHVEYEKGEYIKPIVDHTEQKKKALKIYKKAFS